MKAARSRLHSFLQGGELLASLGDVQALFERPEIDWRLEPDAVGAPNGARLADFEKLLSRPETVLIGKAPGVIYTIRRNEQGWKIKRETTTAMLDGEMLVAAIPLARPSRRLLSRYIRAARIPGALSEERRRLTALQGFIALLLAQLAGCKTPSILECGCGQAPLSLALGAAFDGAKLICLDRSADALAKARVLAGELCLDAEFQAISIPIDKPGSPPDLVLAVHACGQATLDALELGLRIKTRHLALVPCCAPDGYGQPEPGLQGSEINHPVILKLVESVAFTIGCVRRLEEAGYGVAVHEAYLPPWRGIETAIIADRKGSCIPKPPAGA